MSAQMSGWDVPSTPNWGPQDGPEETQAFKAPGDGSRDFGQDFGAPDFGRGGPSSPAGGFPEARGGFPGDGPAGGPPPEFFGQDYGQDQDLGPGPGGFPQRTPGRSLQDLPRRDTRGGRHGGSAPANGYGQDSGYGQDNGYGQEPAYNQEPSFGQEPAFGQEAAYGQDGGYGQQEPSFGQEPAFGQDAAFGRNGAFGQDWGGTGTGTDQADHWGPGGQDSDGGWGRTAGRSAAPWDERPQQDPGYGDANGFGRQEPNGFGRQESNGFGRQEYGRQPENPASAPADYTSLDLTGQQGPGRGPQAPPDYGRRDRDLAARNDPALQDFFAPTRGGSADQRQGWAGDEPPRERFTQAGADWANPAGGAPPRERFTQAGADWANPGGRSPSRTGTGPSPRPGGPRRGDPEPRRGLGAKGLIAIGVVVIIVIAAAAYLLLHKSGSGSPAASTTPSAGTGTAPATKPSGSGTAAGTGTGTGTSAGAGGGTTAAYTLSTPSTAGGHPIGQDPNFLKAATATAAQVSTAVTAGGGGTVKGNPVSAAYQLPASQVITFVGYQGTFTPAKVATILATLGSDPKTYPAGTYGGILGCANTKTAPSGAVCVWADGSTLGVTEFFGATAPETLSPGTEQTLGATDTVKLRADVEKKAS
jgi:hypothetical protein